MTSEIIPELEKRVQEGLISKVTKGDLVIYCYTPKIQDSTLCENSEVKI